jgi:glycine/D-amino acid oxidase-like deaminating enzyme
MTETALRADTIVVGAGLFGCAAALRLAEVGHEVIVLDRGDLGGEASSANSGNLHLQLSPATHKHDGDDWFRGFSRQLPLFQAALAEWRALAAKLPIDIEMRRAGGLMVAETCAEMDTLATKVRLEQQNGLEVELLGPAELRRLAPYIGDGFVGAAFCAEEGMANSLLAVAALSDLCRTRGVRFHLGTAVLGLQMSSDGWTVLTSKGTTFCNHVVIAAGCWSAEIGAMGGIEIPIWDRPIHVSVTEAATPLVPHLCYHTSLRLTLKQTSRGNFIIGGGWPASIDTVRDRPSVLRDSLSQSLWVAQRVVPQVGNLHLLRTWAGRNVYTPDGWPILGAVPGRPGLFLAVCNTYGFTLGPLCGQIVADAVGGKTHDFGGHAVNISRFQSG